MPVHVRRPRLPRAPKARGELAEARFIVKALSLGFSVAKPFGDSLPFDFIVKAGRHLWRVNVKSAWSTHRKGYHFTVEMGRTSHRLRPYSARDLDFIVGYVGPEDAGTSSPSASSAAISGSRLPSAATLTSTASAKPGASSPNLATSEPNARGKPEILRCRQRNAYASANF